MTKTLVATALFLASLPALAQEKVMNIMKTDGTSTQTRVADLKQISFLTVNAGTQGLMVKTKAGETATVLFETNPVVTVSGGTLAITPSSAGALKFEITDIAEILFDDTPNSIAPGKQKSLTCIGQGDGVLLRGIPHGAKPLVCSTDGRILATPAVHNGEARLSRETLGTGVFIVKAGTFCAKVHL